MKHSNQDRRLSEAELQDVTGGHDAFSDRWEQFVSANQQSADATNARSALVGSIKGDPRRYK